MILWKYFIRQQPLCGCIVISMDHWPLRQCIQTSKSMIDITWWILQVFLLSLLDLEHYVLFIGPLWYLSIIIFGCDVKQTLNEQPPLCNTLTLSNLLSPLCNIMWVHCNNCATFYLQTYKRSYNQQRETSFCVTLQTCLQTFMQRSLLPTL